MILVNGSKGIGTGFSTDIMSYNPLQIINKLELMLRNMDHNIDIDPYYQGFNGSIEFLRTDKKYLIKGLYQKISENKIRVTELPIGQWTEDYKIYIENLMDTKKKDKNYIKDYTDLSTDITVDFTIEFYPGCLKDLMIKTTDICGNASISALEKLLKLYTTHSITNMHLFDAKEHLRKFESATEIIEEYYGVRHAFYAKRKKYQIDALEKELVVLSNKARFINDNLGGNIDLRRKKKCEIQEILINKKYDPINSQDGTNFNYLIKMPMDCVSEESVEKLMKEKRERENELALLEQTSIEQIWLNELKELKKEYINFYNSQNENKVMVIKKKKK